MDRTLEKLLGLDGPRTMIVRYADGEVAKEDFEYAKVIDQVLFDEHVGYIATLGPTWNMIHDPRFVKIENCFVIERRGRVGGNANIGQTIFSEGGFAGGNPNDLERYAEILGEGRNMLKAVQEAGLDPQNFGSNSDLVWNFIRRQSPNWFRQTGSPNNEATRLFNMISAGLVSLIADYAELPLSDEWIDAESGELLDDAKKFDSDVMGVYLEVDQLDKALSARAQLRILAARILTNLGLASKLKSEDSRLTDIESDDLLRIIYQSNWPDDKPQLMANLLQFIALANQQPFEEREREQLALASEKSKDTVGKIKTGEIKQINRETDLGTDWGGEGTTRLIDDIMSDPVKRHLFPIFTKAEKENNKEVVDLLSPIFTTPGYVITEAKYDQIVELLASFTTPLPVQLREEEFHSKESPFRA